MKTKKFERVENHLIKLMKQHNQSTDHLAQLTYKDLMADGELEGIGERTIANTLNAFKQKHGIKNVKRSQTKRKRVEDRFKQLITSGKMSMEELMSKRYNDFQNDPALQGIGKTTITCALSDFKKNHESTNFEQSLMSFLEQENGDEAHPVSDSLENDSARSIDPFLANFNKTEVRILKEMIADYKQNNDKEKTALHELQSALRFVGIDSNTLMAHYWNSKRNGLIPDIAMKQQIAEPKKQFLFDSP